MVDFKDIFIDLLSEIKSDKSIEEILEAFRGVPVTLLNERTGGKWSEEKRKAIIDLFKNGDISMFGGSMFKTLSQKTQKYLLVETLENKESFLNYIVFLPGD